MLLFELRVTLKLLLGLVQDVEPQKPPRKLQVGNVACCIQPFSVQDVTAIAEDFANVLKMTFEKET